MKSLKDIQKLITELNIEPRSEMRSKVLGDALEMQRKRKHRSSSGIDMWRIIMTSKMTKFVAAAVVIIAVIVGLNITGGPDMASVAWGEVLGVIENVPTVVFKMSNVTTYSENKTMSSKSEVYDGAGYGVRLDMYMNGELLMQKYMLPEQKVAYMIRPKEKTYSRFPLTDSQTESESDLPRQWVQTILSENYTELGRSNINGIDVEGVEVANSKLLAGDEGLVRLWVDVETNLPVRMELEGEMMEAGTKRPMKFVMDDFQWDIELDEKIFEPNIPEDYKLMEENKKPESMEQKPQKSLSDEEKSNELIVKEVARKVFESCGNQNWDEFSKLWPGLNLNEKQKNYLGGLEIISIGAPFKNDDTGIWNIPYQIKLKSRVIKHTLQISYDKTTNSFIPIAGL